MGMFEINLLKELFPFSIQILLKSISLSHHNLNPVFDMQD